MKENIHRAFVFPGQGSQFVGMGRELFDNFREAKEVFEEVSDTLNYNLTKIIFEGPESSLLETQNAQPALMAVSVATVRVLEKLAGKGLQTLGQYVAGHSLGEYSALCAARSLSLRDTSLLLKTRGEAMQRACAPGEGGMAAVINLPVEQLELLLENYQAFGTIQVANDNSDSQIVISGAMGAVDKIVNDAKDLGFRAVKLNVSAPFHSTFMQSAADIMKQALRDVDLTAPSIKFIPNIHAFEVREPQEIRDALVRQVAGRVRWRETIDYMQNQNITEVVEVGAGKVLTALLKRSGKPFNSINLCDVASIEEFLKIADSSNN